ncbi:MULTISPECIES: ABC transporter ATP-binding protein [unclassified Corynebacterium]|uniref:ABC transporter ATP-binding protein n=1 Tax=unclassified Corynebacterium TaxID=2624378 RepID=UPI001EF59EB8|nr:MULTISPECIES: ABC transporter ATP-binding protein [unclassified Corynebacterium]MCG7243168.1 ABC transporter ATP-binding protein/permease [Corynebacterium sp. ACRPS]MCG7271196.1 ABC transporter ATP-binding protein/permease [Corynebacterium sp. ACRQM]MCG7233690.1 ABC transporter ATP-binding protein/permease [Corynebacterium sp. ACRPR]MDK8473301.1 ABC transporter ATP-binding protein [Corynebacterium sp. MSK078]MDK8658772.1 ABC transporter ATP-binding protein [Corynebacterium sp. MSK204]
MDLVRILFTRSAPYTPYVLAVLILQALSTAATLYLPSLNAKIIDEGVSKGDIDYIWDTGAIMLIVAFVQVITAIGAVWCGSRTAMGVGRDLRSEVFRKVTTFSAEDMSEFGTPTLITRGTNDVQQVQMVYMMMLNFMVTAPIMSIGGIIMAIREDAGLSWLVWVSVAVLLGTISVLIARLMPLFRSMQDKLDTINGTLREQITGIRVVRAFVREAYETERFTKANKDITQLSLKIGQLFVLMFPLITVILNVATGAVLWFGGQRVDAGLVDVGGLTAFLQYLLQILAAVMMGTFMAMMLPRALVCARRITGVLSHEPSITPPKDTVTPETMSGTVEFRNVSFSYAGADAPVLEDVSFTATPGTTTAIIGSTGAGKTTLLSLIPRLYVPSEGEVLIDATPTTSLSRPDIVSRVSLVPQKAYLFSGTVASNLRLGRPEATDDQLWEALRVAQADFVDDLDMPIAQGGTNVSGGQRQRLSIARMLVAQPRIYLFDDSFSALDVVTDANVRAAMHQSFTQRGEAVTTIIVAQRVASIQDADQILVIDKGRIVARGTHTELLKSSEVYQEIVESQETAGVAGGEH